jgi:hypothetical protein
VPSRAKRNAPSIEATMISISCRVNIRQPEIKTFTEI